MSIHEELSIKSMTVSQVYSLFFNMKLKVNRRYQRKLCWTIEEKRNFMDTITKGYPVPMFLFAMTETGEYEIIDGMQRLDTICTFIEQKYSLRDGFFNLESMPDTIELMRQKVLVQKKPELSSDICRRIANYPLPISVFPIADTDSTEEIFKRINSTGKHLSIQELRQIGVNTQFATIIRQLSSEIRGDVSDDVLYLNNMSKISLTNHRLPYSIFVKDIFWVKNEIINSSEIRQSRDEEAIAYIISCMILPNDQHKPFNYQALNKFYGYSSNPLEDSLPVEMTQLNNAIDRIGVDNIKKQFRIVMSCIDEMLVASKKNFRQITETEKSISDIILPFQIIFMAIHRLIIKEHMQCKSYQLLAKKLSGNCGNIVNFIDKRPERREHAVDSIYGLIQNAFAHNGCEDPALDDWTQEFLNIVNKSKTEQNLYDFKIGFVPYNKDAIDKDIISQVLKTLTAINNIGPNKTGYVIIGIADKQEDAIKYKERYGTDYTIINEIPICGIEHDALALQQNIDRYTHTVKEYIRNSQLITEDYKMHILSNMKTPMPYDKHTLVFKTCYGRPVAFNNEYYLRQFTDTNKVEGNQLPLLFENFYR